MGVSCLSTVPPEETINTESRSTYTHLSKAETPGALTPNQSAESLDKLTASPTSEEPLPSNHHQPQHQPHHTKHCKNISSLTSIDEYNIFTTDELKAAVESDPYAMTLTHEALRQHDLQCTKGMDMTTVSTLSISDLSTQDDTLKQIGNQLLSMNVSPTQQNIPSSQHKQQPVPQQQQQQPTRQQHRDQQDENSHPHDTPQKKERHTKKQCEPPSSLHTEDHTVTNEQVSSDVHGRPHVHVRSAYKKYAPRRSPLQENKLTNVESTNSNSMATSHHRRYSSTLSETPVPMDYNIECETMNNHAAKQQYYQSSQVCDNQSPFSHRQNAQQHRNVNANENRFRPYDRSDSEDDDETEGTDEENLNFPDVLHFRKNDVTRVSA